MKFFYALFLSLIVAGTAFAQKKEKIRGSKTVTVIQRETGDFDNLEVEDNLEIFLVKGGTPGLEVEADDNLHEIIKTELNGTTLRIFTLKDASSYKNLSIRVTYTDALKTVTARHETVLNALAELTLNDITIKTFDYTKAFLNVKAGNFSLIMNDKTKAEVNLQATSAVIELSKNADIKALIATPSLKFDMYQKTNAVIEGDAENAVLRIDNNATFTGKKFTVKKMELTAEGYTDCSVMATENIIISASGKSSVQLLGNPKIEMKSFTENASLYKKEQ